MGFVGMGWCGFVGLVKGWFEDVAFWFREWGVFSELTLVSRNIFWNHHPVRGFITNLYSLTEQSYFNFDVVLYNRVNRLILRLFL